LKDPDTAAACGNRDQFPTLRKFPSRCIIDAFARIAFAREMPSALLLLQEINRSAANLGVPPVCNIVQTGRRQPPAIESVHHLMPPIK
jgi:hypothetical protein